MGKATGKTEPTARRMPEAPYARLKRTGSLNVQEVTAADDILAAWQMTAGLPVERDPDLGMPSDEPRAGAADAAAARRCDVLTKYKQWREDMRGHHGIGITFDVLIHEVAPSVIDAGEHWRKGTARRNLIVALRHFAALRGNVPPGARGWKFNPKDTLKQAVRRAKIER